MAQRLRIFNDTWIRVVLILTQVSVIYQLSSVDSINEFQTVTEDNIQSHKTEERNENKEIPNVQASINEILQILREFSIQIEQNNQHNTSVNIQSNVESPKEQKNHSGGNKDFDQPENHNKDELEEKTDEISSNVTLVNDNKKDSNVYKSAARRSSSTITSQLAESSVLAYFIIIIWIVIFWTLSIYSGICLPNIFAPGCYGLLRYVILDKFQIDLDETWNDLTDQWNELASYLVQH